MVGNSIELPVPVTGHAERQRRYNASGKGKAARTRYRRTNSKWETDASYLERAFCAIDGEGMTVNGRHLYTLLAYKDSDGNRDSISNPYGLSSAAIFELLLSQKDTDAIKIIYGASYDFNMWLTDLPLEALKRLYSTGMTIWNGYRLNWLRGKSFRISHYPKGKAVTIYDVVSFFQCPFIKACDDYLGPDWKGRDVIVKNKAKRGEFTPSDTGEIETYNDLELDVLIDLMNELRMRLNKVGLRPRRWDGPGAVAAALLSREDVKEKRGEIPADVAEAARYAYAGGRFEPVLYGSVTAKAYQYDINSAYPSAIRHLPDLSRGSWHTDTRDEYKHFALYHIEYHGKFSDIPGPLFRRDPNGTVCYPLNVTGWYWSPEYEAAKEYCAQGYGTMRVLERKYFQPWDDSRPFEFVERLYAKRRALKKAGDGAHVALKLGLNSLYGKTCQQVGWRRGPDGELRLPPFHSLEWAGYITSHCRAQILKAILCDPEAIVAIETDAVFSTRPLPLTTGSNLGEWEETTYDKLTYVQSGFYFGDGEGGKAKTRGVDRGNLSESDVLAIMFSDEPYVEVSLHRFVGLGIALIQGMNRWQQWEDLSKTMTLRPTGKRVHNPMCNCTRGAEIWHTTMCPMMNAAHSAEFPIEWINPNPDMTDLSDFRRVPTEWEM